MKKIVLGITGEIGGGKDTFTKEFIKQLPDKDVIRIRFSDLLQETLKAWSILPTRQNLQHLAIAMDETYGKGALTHATYERIKNSPQRVIIIEGVRWPTDVALIRRFEHNYLIYVTANPEIRYERIKKRDQKVGEKTLSLKQFKKEAKEATETQIKKIGKKADFMIENNGTLEEFSRQVYEVAQKVI